MCKLLWLFLAMLFLPCAGQAQGTQIVTVTADPATCNTGMLYYNSTTNTLKSCGPNNTWTSSSSTSPSSTFQVIQNGLMADYQMQTTDSACTLKDYSINGNNATSCNGTSPTIASTTGGLVFNNTGSINLPAALNSALTMQFYFTFFGNGLAQASQALLDGSTACCTNTVLVSLVSTGPPAALTGNFRPNVFSNGAYMFSAGLLDVWNGTGVLTLTMGASDLYWINNSPLLDNAGSTFSSAGNMTTGHYQLGGNTTNTTGFTGTIYRALFYNRVLTNAEIIQNQALLSEQMNARGVPNAIGLASTTPTSQNNAVFNGDSISACFGITTCWTNILNPTFISFFSAVYDNSVAGQTASAIRNGQQFIRDTIFNPQGQRDLAVLWAGTNDATGGDTIANIAGYNYSYCRAAKLKIFKCGYTTMISRTAQDTKKNQLNALLRNGNSADFVVDMGGTTQLGADGASASATWFQGDAIHPNQNAAYNIIAPIMSMLINRSYGNNNFTVANTYSSAAPAAVATTSGSETGNIVTLNFAASSTCLTGTVCTCTGITPAGYNQTYYAITGTTTQLTGYNLTSGLGAVTVQGSCSAPQQQDVDQYVILNFGAGNFTLQTCQGYTGQRLYIKNINAGSSTIVAFPAQTGTNTTWTAETIDGSATATVAQNAVLILESQLTSPAAGGCTWKKIQNN